MNGCGRSLPALHDRITFCLPLLDTSAAAPPDAPWRPTALMAVILAGEALGLLLALAPGTEGWVVRFGLVSLGIQWIAVSTLCALFLLRHPLGRLPPMRLAWGCLVLLLAMTSPVACAAWELQE